MPITPIKQARNAPKTHRQTFTGARISGDGAIVERYLDAMRNRDFSPDSIRVYKNDLSLFVRWYEAQTKQPLDVRKLTPVDLQSYRGHLQTIEGKKPATINRRVQVLRSFSRWAYDDGVLAEDIGRNVSSIPTPKRFAPKGLERNEVNAFLRAAQLSARGQGRRNYAIVQTLLQTGLRAGEVAGLHVNDLKLRERSGWLTVRSGKGRKSREVPLNASVRAALSDYLTERKLPPESPLFVSERSGPLSVSGLEMLMKSLAHRAGIERDGINVHSWRHHFALGFLKDHPGDLVGLQRLLGHERLDTTSIYVQPSQDDLAAKMERSSSNVYHR